MNKIKLFAGLGNPGEKYQNTRHNCGFWWIDFVIKNHRLNLKYSEKFRGDIAKYTDAFDMAFVKDGHVMIMCNVTDEEKFYALFDDPKSKEFDSKFNSTDTVYSLQKVE